MNSGTLWLAILTLAPVLLIYLTGANAALVFLSLCLGYVLYAFDSHNALSAINSLHSHNGIPHLKTSSISINLALLLVPAIISIIVQLKSVRGSRKLLNLIPALFCGLLTALIVVPALPSSLANEIAKTSYWTKLTSNQGPIVGLGAAISLVFFSLSSKHRSKRSSRSSL